MVTFGFVICSHAGRRYACPAYCRDAMSKRLKEKGSRRKRERDGLSKWRTAGSTVSGNCLCVMKNWRAALSP